MFAPTTTDLDRILIAQTTRNHLRPLYRPVSHLLCAAQPFLARRIVHTSTPRHRLSQSDRAPLPSIAQSRSYILSYLRTTQDTLAIPHLAQAQIVTTAATTMLLPSALSCDSSQPRLQSALFISPPTSPHHMSTQSAIGNLINSCRNLHSLIASPTASASANSHLPSPPLANVASPMRPRLRKREAKSATPTTNQTELPRYRIKKRVAPPRGANKRRRAVDDDLGRSDQEEGVEFQNENINIFDDNNNDEKPESGIYIFKGAERNMERSPLAAPSTPKRQRIAPPDVPRGLTKEDFHKIGASPPRATQDNSTSPQGTNVEVSKKGDAWSLEDDSKLVEIVLEKVKNMDLSKEVWEDCVRNLPGKDYSSVSTRWKSLLKSERVGLQNRGRRTRGKLHGTW